MDKHLHLNGAGGADLADLLQGQFARQNDPVIAKLCQLFGTLGRVDAHLGGTVQMQRGGDAFDQLRGGKVIGNHGVGARLGDGAHGIRQSGQLSAVDQRI